MSFGLPIISSNVRPMTDILGNSALYFNHENIDSISSCIEKIINSKSLREKMSLKVYNLSKKYSWKKCAHKTFSFIKEIVNDHQL